MCALITKNTIRFNCPVQKIPTKDNVLISLDVGVNFHIARRDQGDKVEQQDVVKFFYNFGPNRLEELLQEECEEYIRDFIRQLRVHRVRDTKTEMTQAICQEMAAKFLPYGVVIEQVNVMFVVLPRTLRLMLWETTNYDVFLQKQQKAQENILLRLQNDENKNMLQLRRDNQGTLFEFKNKFDIAEIQLQESVI